MNPLLEGILRFQRDVFPFHQSRFQDLTQGQQPPILFITCSDSRIDPHMITQAKPGELFIVRNAGNIVPPWGTGDGSTAAAIEYAVEVLGVQHVIVCGHAHCGAMSALLNPDSLKELPAVKAWLRLAEPTRRVMKRRFAGLEGEARLEATIEQNALLQLANLRTHPSVAARLDDGTLALHAWVYQIGTGAICAYDPDQDGFQPMGRVASTEAARVA